MLKDKIAEAVEEYEEVYPDEYALFIKYNEENKTNNKDYGEFSDDGMVERLVYELPEKLYNIIEKKLTAEESEEFNSKDFTSWFVTNYPEFKAIQNV